MDPFGWIGGLVIVVIFSKLISSHRTEYIYTDEHGRRIVSDTPPK